MTTIYTVNNKVLKNSANDKWLTKKETGPTFDSVTIGSQTWMSKNLAIDDGQGGIMTRTVNYGQSDVVEYYYTWDAALRVADTIEGWHLPTDAEFGTLVESVGGYSTAGTKLKSTYGWRGIGNGTDDYGFTALPAGYYWSNFSVTNEEGWFWTANESGESNATLRQCRWNWNNLESNYIDKTVYMSVRLIQDT